MKLGLAVFMIIALGNTVYAKGKTTKYETAVAADKDGSVSERDYITDGTSHVYRLFTNYISYNTGAKATRSISRLRATSDGSGIIVSPSPPEAHTTRYSSFTAATGTTS